MSVPETVKTKCCERRGPTTDLLLLQQFGAGGQNGFLPILSDDETPRLAVAVNRISGLPVTERNSQARDLGELMVVAHSVVSASQQDPTIGSIALINTVTILRRAANSSYLLDRRAMRETYQRVRGLDDGLLSIDSTELVSPRDLGWSPVAIAGGSQDRH